MGQVNLAVALARRSYALNFSKSCVGVAAIAAATRAPNAVYLSIVACLGCRAFFTPRHFPRPGRAAHAARCPVGEHRGAVAARPVRIGLSQHTRTGQRTHDTVVP